jgi:hypothetical protein
MFGYAIRRLNEAAGASQTRCAASVAHCPPVWLYIWYWARPNGENGADPLTESGRSEIRVNA